MPICQSCKKFAPEEAEFCPACGKPLVTDEHEKGALQTTVINGKGGNRAVHFRRAGKIKRLAAGFIDCAIVIAMIAPLQRFALARSSKWALIPYIVPCIYLLLKDSIGGRSLGKWLTNLVTVNLRTLKRADFADSIIRNWFLTVIIVPPTLFKVVSLGTIIFSAIAFVIALQILFGCKRRLGDGWARTQVVDMDTFENQSS